MSVKHARIWLAFYKVKQPKSTFIDKAIGVWTRGPYSHVEIVTKDINSPTKYTMRSFTLTDGGGFRAKPHKFDKRFYDYRMIKVENIDALLEFSEGIRDRKYDILGIIFSQVLPIGLDQTMKWFCSEYCVQALQVAGTDDKRFWYLKPNMIHPNKLSRIVGIDYDKKKTFKKRSDKEMA